MPNRPKRPKKVHQRPELQKIIDFMDIQCKIINKWECNTKKPSFYTSSCPDFNLGQLKLHKMKFTLELPMKK